MNTTNNHNDDAADAAAEGEPMPERLGYSGMTNATGVDGTAATDNALPGTSPTGKETARASDVLDERDDDGSDGSDGSTSDLLSRLQPGTAPDNEARSDEA